MRIRTGASDPLAVTISCVLVVAVVCRTALASLATTPAKLATVLPPLASPASDSTRVFLVVDSATDHSSGLVQWTAATNAGVVRVNWAAATRGRGDSGSKALVSLIRGFGYSRLPVVLTVDEEGHLLQIREGQDFGQTARQR